MIRNKHIRIFFLTIFFILIIPLLLPPVLPAQQQQYTVSGLVLDTGGRGIDGVSISFYDGESWGYATTSGGGYYSHTVYSGWQGTVTADHYCYSFTPVSPTIGPVNQDTTRDFTGTRYTFTISGVVSDGPPQYSGETLLNPVQGVQMKLSTGAEDTTGPDGSYSIPVDCSWVGTLTPLKAGWQFAPPSVVYYEPPGEDVTANFVGTASTTEYSISGQVTDNSGRIGMDGVTITFFDGVTVHEEITSGGGYYSYNVPVFWTGTVAPSLAGYVFSPTFAGVGPVQNNITENFVAEATTYIISGSVVDTKANPIVAVTMTLSSGAADMTNASGQYEFEVIHGWSGNLTADKTGWSFNPTYRNYNGVVSDLNNEHFFGIKVKDQYTISGTITLGGAALANVVMSGLPGDPVTDTAGFYSGTVTKGWSGTVTPTLSGYAFKPADRSYANVKDNYTNQNYEAFVNDPPVVKILSPMDNAFVSGEVLIETEASDSDGIDRVELYIDDQKAAEYNNIQAKADKLDPHDLAGLLGHNRSEIQVDGSGNTYSLMPGKDGTTALVRRKGPGKVETLLEGDIAVSRWSVKPGGTVIIAGTTLKTGERWLKSLIPNKETGGMPGSWLDIKWDTGAAGSEAGEIDIADLTVSAAAATFTCKYLWDTSLYDLGTHAIMAKAYDTKELEATDEIKTTISTITLQLQLERKTEKAWIVAKEYVTIHAAVNNPQSVPTAKYMIFRKGVGGVFTAVAEVPASQVQGNSFTYNDKGIENGKTYTYKVEAVDENGITVGGSQEETI